jgi:hypothetical protein
VAKITNPRELILHCTWVNEAYMRLPAGMVSGYNLVADLYRRLATQSRQCAEAWVNDQCCPDHEPAVDAFWVAVVPWAISFGQSLHLDPGEWHQAVVHPHEQFVQYLTNNTCDDPIKLISGTPSEIIMKLDAEWMSRVAYLTGRWAWFRYLPDIPALAQAKQLDSALQEPGSEAQKAYLKSDLVFFRQLFEPFPFSESMRSDINGILAQVEDEIKYMCGNMSDGRL